MNFQIAGTGRSFKGAFAYYLHDKRKEPDGPHLATAERVAWMEVRNLAVQEPEAVQGVMIATARSADELKAAAGVKATGRKSTAGAVFAYSIQWHPDNETIPDRAGMLAAAEATLKLLGAENHQAAIIAHSDTAHPHLHVIVNRVDPATGKSLSLDKSALKLDKWAADYERERGQIVSPNRDKKHEARRQREAAAKLERDFDAAKKPLPTPAQARKPDPAPTPAPKPQTAPQAPENAKAAAPQKQVAEAAKSRAAKLAEQQAQQKERHKAEWRQLAALNKARRDEAFARAAAATKEAQAQHKADTRPGWSAFFKQERAARREMDRRETYLGGIISAAVVLAAHEQFDRKGGGSFRGFLSAAFAYSTDRDRRKAAFEQHWQQQREAAAVRLKAPLDAKMQAVRDARAADLEKARQAFAADRSALVARQNAEAAKIRQAWRELYAERDRLAAAQEQSRARMQQRGPQNYRHGRRLDRVTTRQPIDSQAKAPPGQKPSPQPQEKAAVKSAFERSADVAAAKRSPEAGERVSVSVPAPAPAPEGVPVPPAREVRTVPADRPQAWAQTPEGQKATAPQKAAPDSLRRGFDKQPEQPPRPGWMAAAKQSPQPAQPAPAKDWRTAATPAPEPSKPAPAPAWRQEQDSKPKPTTPQRGRFRDEWERDR